MSVDKTIFIKCECKGEGIGVDYDAEDGYYYFSYWSYGLSNRKMSWRQKIRYCWNVLTKGKAFNDEIMLNQKSVDKLADFLLWGRVVPGAKLVKIYNEFENNKEDG